MNIDFAKCKSWVNRFQFFFTLDHLVLFPFLCRSNGSKVVDENMKRLQRRQWRQTTNKFCSEKLTSAFDDSSFQVKEFWSSLHKHLTEQTKQTRVNNCAIQWKYIFLNFCDLLFWTIKEFRFKQKHFRNMAVVYSDRVDSIGLKIDSCKLISF